MEHDLAQGPARVRAHFTLAPGSEAAQVQIEPGR